MLPEDDQVELIAQVAGGGPGVLVGIGDDAAVLAGGVLVSSDMLVDGVHFDRSRLSPRQIGHRAAGANLSDLAAMGGAATCLVASFGIPVGFHDVQELAAGLTDHGVPLAGGDLVRSPVLVVSVTVVGHADKPVRRDGGIPGDVLIVSGPLGGQAASGYTLPVTPRLAEGALLAKIGARHDRHLRRHRHRCAAAGPRVRDRRADRARAAAARARGDASSRRPPAARTTSCWPPFRPHAPLPGWATVVGRLTADPQVVLIDADGRDRDDLQGHDHFR